MKADEIDFEKLTAALDATAKKRGSAKILEQYRDIMQTVKSSEVMQKQWKNYQKDFLYAENTTFDDACDAVLKLMSRLKETAAI
jgi:glutathionylspermidine synthase